MVDDVACDETFLTELLSGLVACQSVQIGSEQCCLERRIVLRKQGEDDSGEDVAASGGCHSRIACGVEHHVSFGRHDCRVGPFDDDIDVVSAGKESGLLEFLVAVRSGTDESTQFLLVGREDGIRRELVDKFAMRGKQVERVGVDDERPLMIMELLPEGTCRLLVGSESGSDATALNEVVSNGRANISLCDSMWSTASGMLICNGSTLASGVWTVSLPAPLRIHALEARMAAPAMPRRPAMRQAWPNVPLWENRGRVLSMALASTCSKR